MDCFLLPGMSPWSAIAAVFRTLIMAGCFRKVRSTCSCDVSLLFCRLGGGQLKMSPRIAMYTSQPPLPSLQDECDLGGVLPLPSAERTGMSRIMLQSTKHIVVLALPSHNYMCCTLCKRHTVPDPLLITFHSWTITRCPI